MSDRDRQEYVHQLNNPEIVPQRIEDPSFGDATRTETEDELAARRAQHEANRAHDPFAAGGIFDPNLATKGRIKHVIQRQEQLEELVRKTFVTQVQQPNGDLFMKVSWKEFMAMRQDPKFRSLGNYMRLLTHYPDGRMREKPIRPIVGNEVGMYHGPLGEKIVYLRDSGPDDVGEGKYYVVGIDLERSEAAAAEADKDGNIVGDAIPLIDLETEPSDTEPPPPGDDTETGVDPFPSRET